MIVDVAGRHALRVRTVADNPMFERDSIFDRANVLGLFVWVRDLKGDVTCERWAADTPPTKRPEPLTAYALNEEQMMWPLDKLATLFPPPIRSPAVSKIKIS